MFIMRKNKKRTATARSVHQSARKVVDDTIDSTTKNAKVPAETIVAASIYTGIPFKASYDMLKI